MDEVSLAMGEMKRQRVAQKLSGLAVPGPLKEEFLEQQRILVEQRRVLAQLRSERLQAEGEQRQLARRNRNRWAGADEDARARARGKLGEYPDRDSVAERNLRTVSGRGRCRIGRLNHATDVRPPHRMQNGHRMHVRPRPENQRILNVRNSDIETQKL